MTISVQKLAEWIREEVAAAHAKGVVFGLSGGIDSTVVGALCHRALPKTAVGVCMPCYSHEKDLEHARTAAACLGFPLRTVPLDDVFNALSIVLPKGGCDTGDERLVWGNLKSRLRMTVLYCLANQVNYLVVGSSNRSELAIGYFTKYGDGAADILPLGNLLKGEVRALAMELDVPREIIDKPPSAGLWPGQTDEEELGFTYEQLDRYLAGCGVEEGVRRKIEALCERSAHKRRMAPIPSF
ncbi:MAG: NAD(+) synthase [Chloroflexota bacterium]